MSVTHYRNMVGLTNPEILFSSMFIGIRHIMVFEESSDTKWYMIDAD